MQGNGKNGKAVIPLLTVTGQFLAHTNMTLVERAFPAGELHRGDRQLIEPTVIQSAQLCRVNRTYAHWALRRSAEEQGRIEAGVIPLVPPATRALPAPASPEARLAEIVTELGGVMATVNALAASRLPYNKPIVAAQCGGACFLTHSISCLDLCGDSPSANARAAPFFYRTRANGTAHFQFGETKYEHGANRTHSLR